MCGICGICNFNRKEPISEELIKDMSQVLSHRGPDDSGIYIDKNIAMGLRRLSIIDIAKGHQPVHNEDKTVWIVCNGEIYNYVELRKELIGKGHKFYTHSDTETIVHLYEEYGEEAFSKLNGMFAFALWDERKGRLFLVRDRIGIKPLFYTLNNGQLLFASEIKAILKDRSVKKEINYEAVDIYFSLYYIPHPNTIFKNIFRLPPAHYLVYEKGKTKIEKYWQMDYSVSREKNPEYYSDQIRSILKDSVKRCLQSEVPLGVFLSGGLDSTSIVALMSEVSGNPIKTFSLGFLDKSYNELNEAKTVAKMYNTEHQEYIMRPSDIHEYLPKVIEFFDEPNGDWSSVANYILARNAKRSVTVALSGAGGDEIFGGYPTITAYKLAKQYRKLPVFIRRGIVERIVKKLPVSTERLSFDYRAKAFIKGAELPPEEAHFRWKEIFSPEEKQMLYSGQLKNRTEEFDSFNVFRKHFGVLKDADMVNNLLYLDLRVFHAGCTLYLNDITTMAVALETRTPFLDNQLVEFAASMPVNLKHKNFTTKYIFRKAMEKLLPGKIIRMGKKGFIIPGASWIQHELRDFVCDILNPAKIKETGLLNAEYVQMVLEQHFSGRRDNTRKITCLVSFMIWYNKFFK